MCAHICTHIHARRNTKHLHSNVEVHILIHPGLNTHTGWLSASGVFPERGPGTLTLGPGLGVTHSRVAESLHCEMGRSTPG